MGLKVQDVSNLKGGNNISGKYFLGILNFKGMYEYSFRAVSHKGISFSMVTMPSLRFENEILHPKLA
jgi:hypothetical protein